jgi:putative tryptophan/tyrosine transport system substrate-binding protein
MSRRNFLLLTVGAATLPRTALTQPTANMLRVGCVAPLSRYAPYYVAFEQRLAELGYQEGKNFFFEFLNIPSISHAYCSLGPTR